MDRQSGVPWPRPLLLADDDIRALWTELAPHVTHPIARALLWDIRFTLSLGRNNRDNADKAARGYLDRVGGTLRLTWQAEGLVRAWTLARTVGLTTIEQDVTAQMRDMATASLANGEGAGVVIPLLAALAEPPRRGHSAPPVDPAIDHLLDQALSAYPESILVAQVATIIRRRAGIGTPRADTASRAEVQAHLREADASDGIVQMTHLQDAATAARRYKIKDLEDVAVTRMQSAPPIQWATIGHDINIPASAMEGFLRQFDRQPTWRGAMALWFQQGAPSGSLEHNENAARAAFRGSIVRQLARNVIFGCNDLPERTLNTEEERIAQQLCQQETWQYSLNGILLADALDRIKARYGAPQRTDVLTFLCDQYGADPYLARACATALDLYWASEYDASAHLIAPKIEAAARSLLLELDAPLYRAEMGKAHGQFPGLGVLLPPLLEHGLDPDWERFLGTLLLSRGENIRNLIAHGFMHDISRDKTALLLRAAALLILITGPETSRRDADTVTAALTNPTRKTRTPWRRRITNAAHAAWQELRR